jgi:vacuolar protein sorting-associated protein 13A/C
MSVGIDGCMGKPMIREGQGFDVYVRRSLRDVFRKVPTFCVEVKVIFVLEFQRLVNFFLLTWWS